MILTVNGNYFQMVDPYKEEEVSSSITRNLIIVQTLLDLRNTLF
jgi:hypothetical protein